MSQRSTYRQHVLVVRLSALGDVAILQPVLLSRAVANPDVLFTLAAPPLLEPLFSGVENIRFLPTKKKQSPKDLYRHLSAVRPTVVTDMHWVNRVIMADWLFRMHGIRVVHIDKHRADQRGLVRNGADDYHPLRPSWQLYDDVFDRLQLAPARPNLLEQSRRYLTPTPTARPRIGIAPFAQHRGKIWPEENMIRLIAMLAKHEDFDILLFGGKSEASTLEAWAEPYANVSSTAGRQSFADELEVIRSLTLMVSMDSANMHFASCLGVPVVSLWGATHPYGGFEGWRQDPYNSLQLSLACRPCSMYGNRPCRLGDYRCLAGLKPEMVYSHIMEIIKH